MPNKRGALFLKNYLSQIFGKTIWLPTIISTEDLITELSGLKVLEEIDLICHLYESYRMCYGNKAETFDSFAKWGQLILQDFNEIDRYLADSEQLYENLKDIKEIENWSLGEEVLSEYQQDYLQFMNSLGAIYKHFSSFLLSKKWAYQGLAYKQAVLNVEGNAFTPAFNKILFCGFNALNAAELKIFNFLYQSKKADLLWDADQYYLNDVSQEAGLFLRNNLSFFKQKDPFLIENNFAENKHISIISVPKQIGQAQVVKQCLQRLLDESVPLDKVAVVLANEKLLWPVLQQLPPGVEHVNITMEYPLKYTSTYSLIDGLMQIQLNFGKQKKQQKTIYHKDLVNLLRQPLFQNYLKAKKGSGNGSKIINEISQRNLSFISQQTLALLLGKEYSIIGHLFQPIKSVANLCTDILDLLQTTIDYFSKQPGNNHSHLELEYLQIILRNFNRLNDILQRYPYFNDLQSFKQLYTQVVGNSSAPFIGEPLKGLQVMGVLETRTLDFDHIILVNVNEGVLPSGKTINSFIPNDLKRAFGLPLYVEKDAIYAYHFYRLLQRAKDTVITYDSETDTFGKGEKSRFVTQLQLEMNKFNPNIQIIEKVASYPGFPLELKNIIAIQKDENIMERILKKASSIEPFGGLSPSGLIAHKECPLRFYFRYGAGLKEIKEVEESAEANTFGSILHLSLENLYRDFTEKIIHPESLKEQLKKVDLQVNQSFISFFDNNPPSGKSLLQEEVIKVYVKKLIKSDLKFIEGLRKQNQVLTLTGLEQEFSAPLNLVIEGQPTLIYIKGKVDRIDSFGGKVRVMDYKSSVKPTDKFSFDGFEKLFLDKNYNKQLQLILYCWMIFKNGLYQATQLTPCIVPFKNFSDEPKFILSGKEILTLTDHFLNDFETELTNYVEEIFNRQIPFTQTEDRDAHKYCPYNTICNFAT